LKLEAPPKLAQSKRERGWGKVCYIIVWQQTITTTTNQILLKQTIEVNNRSNQPKQVAKTSEAKNRSKIIEVSKTNNRNEQRKQTNSKSKQ
jgi:hypothetical protein